MDSSNQGSKGLGYSLKNSQTLLIFLILCFIYMQQVAVINVGGSFKVYEFFATILLGLWILSPQKKIHGLNSLILFLFFIIIPIFSYTFFFFDSLKDGYFLKYPDANGIIRYNPNIAPFIIYFYYLIVWVTINTFTGSQALFKHRDFFIKTFILTGTALAIYCWYGLFGVHLLHLPDPIAILPDYRKYNPVDSIRFCGLSSEPSIYIQIECWVFLGVLFFKNLFKKSTWAFLIVLHLFTIIMTFSSALLAMLVSTLIYTLLVLPMRKKIQIVTIVASVFTVLILIVESIGLGDLAYYFLVQKISNFLIPSNHTLDSGAFRSFTARVGMEIFKDHPIIGVGPGMSVMFMYLYENSLGIVEWGQRLRHDSLVENCHSQILAETGILGYGLIMYFFSRFSWQCWKRRKDDPIFAFGLTGALMTLMMFASIHPIHSLFFWVPLALVMNTLHHQDKGLTISTSYKSHPPKPPQARDSAPQSEISPPVEP